MERAFYSVNNVLMDSTSINLNAKAYVQMGSGAMMQPTFANPAMNFVLPVMDPLKLTAYLATPPST